MALKLLKRGQTYYVRGTVSAIGPDGERQTVSFYKSAGTGDKSLAQAILTKNENRILDEIVYGKAKVVTFKIAAEDYIASGGSARFILDIREDGTESGLMVHFDETLLASITQEVLDKTAKEIYPSAQPETLNRQVYTPFIAVWNHTFSGDPKMTRKWRRPRKAKGTNVVRIARVKRSGTAPVDYERAATFVAAMSPAPSMFMTALFYTGLRPIEAFALTAPNVNVLGRWIVIPDSKTGEPRGVPMHEFLVPMFASLLKRNSLADDERVFRGPRGEPYKEVQEGGGGLKTAISGARRRSGIKDVSPYTARHTCSTGLVIAGVHPHIKDQILGHAADDMSRHYTNVPQAPLIEAINKLPVPDKWKALPWWQDPLAWSGKLAEGTGKRTDLERKVG